MTVKQAIIVTDIVHEPSQADEYIAFFNADGTPHSFGGQPSNHRQHFSGTATFPDNSAVSFAQSDPGFGDSLSLDPDDDTTILTVEGIYAVTMVANVTSHNNDDDGNVMYMEFAIDYDGDYSYASLCMKLDGDATGVYYQSVANTWYCPEGGKIKAETSARPIIGLSVDNDVVMNFEFWIQKLS